MHCTKYQHLTCIFIRVLDMHITESAVETFAQEYYESMDLKLNQVDLKDDSICAICRSESKYFVFGPCGHFHTCKSCGLSLKVCPICESEIKFKTNFQRLRGCK